MATISSIASDGWYQLAQLKAEQCQQQQAYNNLQQQLTNPMFFYQPDQTVPYTTTTTATLGNAFTSWAQGAYSKARIKFWRVNQVVEIDEGQEMADPLDKLRLSVARWLKPQEKYNFA